jgi:hypothetical protein
VIEAANATSYGGSSRRIDDARGETDTEGFSAVTRARQATVENKLNRDARIFCDID